MCTTLKQPKWEEGPLPPSQITFEKIAGAADKLPGGIDYDKVRGG